MTERPHRDESRRDLDAEHHDGDEQPVCVGQWCCGCKSHPIGKPWGWNHEAWDAHFTRGHRVIA